MFDADAPEGALAVAEEQTAGRGRLGRTWEAPAGTSILASVVLRPPVAPPRLPELSLVAGEAVAAALRDAAGVDPTLKYPNDVLLDGRKVAGILAESSEGRVVLGIGVNVNQTAAELPPGVPATSLRLATGQPFERAPLLASVLARLEHGYDAWVRGLAAGD
jgi:BirA family biotin operon repressor/biotin-[acetyl-CoA-carboxylase] ligase